MEYKGIEYLRQKLDKYRVGALKRQKIYDMKNKEIEPSLTIPPQISRNSYLAGSRFVWAKFET